MSWPDVGIFQALHSLKVMDVMNGSRENGAPIIQWDQHGAGNQQFRIEPLGSNQFALRAVHSGKVLDVWEWSTANGGRIIQWDWHGGNNQRWAIDDAGVAGDPDLFALRSIHSGKVLDVSGISRGNGAQIVQWDWVGGNNQRWRIVLP
jgi:ricin-type beta-trefoil lectin protein